MSRLVFLSGLGLALAGLAFALTDRLVAPPPNITPENVRRIAPGMTVEQVRALLGALADCDVRYRPCVHGPLWDELGYPEACQWWTAPAGGGVYVGFGPDRRVTGYSARGECGKAALPPSILFRVRAWLGI